MHYSNRVSVQCTWEIALRTSIHHTLYSFIWVQSLVLSTKCRTWEWVFFCHELHFSLSNQVNPLAWLAFSQKNLIDTRSLFSQTSNYVVNLSILKVRVCRNVFLKKFNQLWKFSAECVRRTLVHIIRDEHDLARSHACCIDAQDFISVLYYFRKWRYWTSFASQVGSSCTFSHRFCCLKVFMVVLYFEFLYILIRDPFTFSEFNAYFLNFQGFGSLPGAVSFPFMILLVRLSVEQIFISNFGIIWVLRLIVSIGGYVSLTVGFNLPVNPALAFEYEYSTYFSWIYEFQRLLLQITKLYWLFVSITRM
jgi:hypothetical protein